MTPALVDDSLSTANNKLLLGGVFADGADVDQHDVGGAAGRHQGASLRLRGVREVIPAEAPSHHPREGAYW